MIEFAPAKFDFSKYRQPELAEKISDILSLPGVVMTIFKWLLIVVVGFWVLLPVIYAQYVHLGVSLH